MNATVRHPNFPLSLSITPNGDCLPNKSLQHLLEGNSGDAFGIEAQREAISRYGIAGRVWEAAYALCAYVDPPDGDDVLDFDPPFAEDPRSPLGVIELGSGTGIVSASVARMIQRAATPGGFVIATDLPDVCPLLRHNLGICASTAGESRPGSATVSVRPLAWGNRDHAAAIANELGARRLTHIVCSDLASICVYFPELLGPLLRTLIHLTASPCLPSPEPPVEIVISYKIRSLPKEAPFWSAFGLWFLFRLALPRRRVRPVESKNAPLGVPDGLEPWRQFAAHEDADRIFVFVAHRRAESIAWQVPETDTELVEGVGARGTTTKKGDDTFETILFMAIGIETTGE